MLIAPLQLLGLPARSSSVMPQFPIVARHAGRGGSGAVLGAKNIKAIAVRGQQRTEWFDQEGLIKEARDLSKRSFGPATQKYRELGTAANVLVFNRLGCLPTEISKRGHLKVPLNCRRKRWTRHAIK